MVIDKLKDDKTNKNNMPWQPETELIKFFYAILTHSDEVIKQMGRNLYLSMLNEEVERSR